MCKLTKIINRKKGLNSREQAFFHIIRQRILYRNTVRKEDFMETKKNPKRPGYAYVPFQRMEKVYSPSKAIKVGTIFPELNIPMEDYQRGLFNGK